MDAESICVSLETAKKLKEAGWNKETVFIWADEGDSFSQWYIEVWGMFFKRNDTLKDTPHYYYAPTSAEIELPIEITCINYRQDLDGIRYYWCQENFFNYEDRIYTKDVIIGCFGPQYSKIYSIAFPAKEEFTSEVEAKAATWLYLKEKGLI